MFHLNISLCNYKSTAINKEISENTNFIPFEVSSEEVVKSTPVVIRTPVVTEAPVVT